MTRTFVLAALLTAACAASVRAAESAPPLKATTKDAFSAVVVELHKEMQESGRYAYVTERERADVEKELDRMRALLEKSGSVDTMGKDDQVALFNAQESVNAGPFENSHGQPLLRIGSSENRVTLFGPMLVMGGGEMRREPGADVEGDLAGATFHGCGVRLHVGEGLVDVVIGHVGEGAALIDGLAAGQLLQREARRDAHGRAARPA